VIGSILFFLLTAMPMESSRASKHAFPTSIPEVHVLL
jgi:hypothetical protein